MDQISAGNTITGQDRFGSAKFEADRITIVTMNNHRIDIIVGTVRTNI